MQVLRYQQSPATHHLATQALQMVLDTADLPKNASVAAVHAIQAIRQMGFW